VHRSIALLCALLSATAAFADPFAELRERCGEIDQLISWIDEDGDRRLRSAELGKITANLLWIEEALREPASGALLANALSADLDLIEWRVTCPSLKTEIRRKQLARLRARLAWGRSIGFDADSLLERIASLEQEFEKAWGLEDRGPWLPGDPQARWWGNWDGEMNFLEGRMPGLDREWSLTPRILAEARSRIQALLGMLPELERNGISLDPFPSRRDQLELDGEFRSISTLGRGTTDAPTAAAKLLDRLGALRSDADEALAQAGRRRTLQRAGIVGAGGLLIIPGFWLLRRRIRGARLLATETGRGYLRLKEAMPVMGERQLACEARVREETSPNWRGTTAALVAELHARLHAARGCWSGLVERARQAELLLLDPRIDSDPEIARRAAGLLEDTSRDQLVGRAWQDAVEADLARLANSRREAGSRVAETTRMFAAVEQRSTEFPGSISLESAAELRERLNTAVALAPTDPITAAEHARACAKRVQQLDDQVRRAHAVTSSAAGAESECVAVAARATAGRADGLRFGAGDADPETHVARAHAGLARVRECRQAGRWDEAAQALDAARSSLGFADAQVAETRHAHSVVPAALAFERARLDSLPRARTELDEVLERLAREHPAADGQDIAAAAPDARTRSTDLATRLEQAARCAALGEAREALCLLVAIRADRESLEAVTAAALQRIDDLRERRRQGLAAQWALARAGR